MYDRHVHYNYIYHFRKVLYFYGYNCLETREFANLIYFVSLAMFFLSFFFFILFPPSYFFYAFQQLRYIFLKRRSLTKVPSHVRAYIQLIAESEDGLQVLRITYKSVGCDLLVLISYESWSILRAPNAERKVFGFSDDRNCKFKLNKNCTRIIQINGNG